MRGESWSSLLRRAERYEFPAYSYILEHSDGLIAIDTGMTSRARTPRAARRMVPEPVMEPDQEIGPQMRARGLRPGDVRLVIVTHLDWDHVGGVGHFPHAEILVHRPEYAFSKTFMGSKTLTDRMDVRLVPIPGHSIAQVGVVVQTDDLALFFGADHMLRQDWFAEDYRAGRLIQLGIFYREQAAETSRRIHRFAEETPTILLPAHDADAATRLAAREPLRV